MTDCGEGAVCPPAPDAPAPDAPPAVTTGNADITVMLEARCWDTFANGESGSSDDRPFEGVDVRIQPATGAVRSATTLNSGVASIVTIGVGRATVTATKDGWDPATGNVDITAGGTAALTLTMHRPAGYHGCTRKHPPKPPPSGEIGEAWLGPFFWSGEPWILLLRDILWLVLVILAAILIPIGIAIPSQYVCLSLGAFFFAIAMYVNHIMFGMILGVIGMVLAFLGFVAIVVFQIMAMMTSPPLPLADTATGAFGLPHADPYMFPDLCAIWFGFAGGLIAGRREFFNYYQWAAIIVVAVICGVLAAAIYLLMDFFMHGMQFSQWGFAVLQFFMGLIAGLIGAFFGHVFINDGNLEDGTTFQITDLELPYAGVRYCVQGHRGYISHFLRRYEEEVEIPNPGGGPPLRGKQARMSDQEYSYDWSLPEGTPILAAKDGHITAYKEDRTGNAMAGNSQENFIYVKHKDGSIAQYLHLRRGGVLEVNAFLSDPANRTESPTAGRNDDGTPNTSRGVQYRLTDPVFVYVGQRLAAVGNVGLSMFDHIHFDVVAVRPNGDRIYAPIKFKDPDVASHEGRCYSMRSYRSGNIDRGPASLT